MMRFRLNLSLHKRFVPHSVTSVRFPPDGRHNGRVPVISLFWRKVREAVGVAKNFSSDAVSRCIRVEPIHNIIKQLVEGQFYGVIHVAFPVCGTLTLHSLKMTATGKFAGLGLRSPSVARPMTLLTAALSWSFSTIWYRPQQHAVAVKAISVAALNASAEISARRPAPLPLRPRQPSRLRQAFLPCPSSAFPTCPPHPRSPRPRWDRYSRTPP
jgi:hypothetical protein